jgi:hypothetical protein
MKLNNGHGNGWLNPGKIGCEMKIADDEPRRAEKLFRSAEWPESRNQFAKVAWTLFV